MLRGGPGGEGTRDSLLEEEEAAATGLLSEPDPRAAKSAPKHGPGLSEGAIPGTLGSVWPYVVVCAAVLQWWFFNIVVIIGNKWIFQNFKFVFPMTLTTVHFIVSYLGALFCIKVLKLSTVIEVKREDRLSRILPLAVITCANIVLGNVSLRYIPVSFVQTIKALTPAATVLLQATVWGKKYHPLIYASLVPVVGGMIMASVNELSFVWFGFCAAMAGVVVTAASSIAAELLLSGKYKFDSLNTVYHMIPYSIQMLVLPALLFEGRGVAQYLQATPGVAAPVAAILASGVLAFGLNFSLYAAIKATSAVTFCVVGNFKVAVAVFSSWLVFRNPMSLLSILGCTVTIAGCTYYGYLQQKLGSPAPRAAAPRRTPARPQKCNQRVVGRTPARSAQWKSGRVPGTGQGPHCSGGASRRQVAPSSASTDPPQKGTAREGLFAAQTVSCPAAQGSGRNVRATCWLLTVVRLAPPLRQLAQCCRLLEEC